MKQGSPVPEIVSIINKRHLQIEKVNNEPPRTPEHQIYQSQQNQRRTRTGKKVDDSYELASNLSEDDYNKDNEENKKVSFFVNSSSWYLTKLTHNHVDGSVPPHWGTPTDDWTDI